jgi:GT2 family glycosyltransferase
MGPMESSATTPASHVAPAPKISVIIPTCDRNDMLARLLDGLAPGVQTLPADRYEVIVTDDGRKGSAEAMIAEKYPWVRWVDGPRTQRVENRNSGARYARGEWLVFLDDDTIPDAVLLEAYDREMKPGVPGLCGAIYATSKYPTDLGECPVNHGGDGFWSANVAIHRDRFFELDGWQSDHHWGFYEDVDMGLRLRQFGDVPFVPDARVGHDVRQLTLVQALKLMPHRITGWGLYARKNMALLGLKSYRGIYLMMLKHFLLAFVSHLKQRHYKQSFLDIANIVVGIPVVVWFVNTRPFRYATPTNRPAHSA